MIKLNQLKSMELDLASFWANKFRLVEMFEIDTNWFYWW